MKISIKSIVFILTLVVSSSAIAQKSSMSAGLTLSQRRTLFTEGTTSFYEKKYKKAVQYFEQLVDQYPELQDYVQFFLANTYLNLGENQKALLALQNFLSQYPSHPIANTVRYNVANLLLAEEKYIEAIELYTFLLNQPEEDQGKVYYQLGRAFLGIKNYQEAISAFHQVLSFYPEHPYRKEAYQYFQSILKNHPKLQPQWTEETLLEHANALLKARFYTSAIKQYESFKTQYPKSSRIEECEFGIVNAYFQSRNTEKGMSTLEQLVTRYTKMNPEIAARAIYTIGIKHWNADRNTQAKRYMQRIITEYGQSSWGDDACYVIGRIYQSENKYNEAAKWYENLHRMYPTSAFVEETLWRAGWTHYLSQQYPRAEQLFLWGSTAFPFGSYYDDSVYWQGRTFEKLKDQETALKAYHHLVQVSPATYYGILAQRRIGTSHTTSAQKEASDPPELSFLLMQLKQTIQPALYDEITQHLNKAIELREVTLKKYAVREVDWMASRYNEISHTPSIMVSEGQNPSVGNSNQQLLFTYFLCRLYATIGEYLKSIQLASKIESEIQQQSVEHSFPYVLETVKYPLAYWDIIKKQAVQHNLDPLLVAAIIRQESAYDPEAVSSANAKGLMQIIPKTGKRVASKIGLKNFKTSQLYDPDINILLGTTYLAELLEKYNGNLYRSLAAYNAGPDATNKWWPEKGEVDHEVIVENITYRATRNYVKRILRNQYHYSTLYSDLL
jgi:soluble lytic murein transglycosylase